MGKWRFKWNKQTKSKRLKPEHTLHVVGRTNDKIKRTTEESNKATVLVQCTVMHGPLFHSSFPPLTRPDTLLPIHTTILVALFQVSIFDSCHFLDNERTKCWRVLLCAPPSLASVQNTIDWRRRTHRFLRRPEIERVRVLVRVFFLSARRLGMSK